MALAAVMSASPAGRRPLSAAVMREDRVAGLILTPLSEVRGRAARRRRCRGDPPGGGVSCFYLEQPACSRGKVAAPASVEAWPVPKPWRWRSGPSSRISRRQTLMCPPVVVVVGHLFDLCSPPRSPSFRKRRALAAGLDDLLGPHARSGRERGAPVRVPAPVCCDVVYESAPGAAGGPALPRAVAMLSAAAQCRGRGTSHRGTAAEQLGDETAAGALVEVVRQSKGLCPPRPRAFMPRRHDSVPHGLERAAIEIALAVAQSASAHAEAVRADELLDALGTPVTRRNEHALDRLHRDR